MKTAKIITKKIIKITPKPNEDIINGMMIQYNKRISSDIRDKVNFRYHDIKAYQDEYEIPIIGNGAKIIKITLKDKYKTK